MRTKRAVQLATRRTPTKANRPIPFEVPCARAGSSEGYQLYFPKYGCEDWSRHRAVFTGTSTDAPRLAVPSIIKRDT